MNKKSREIECLTRLNQVSMPIDDILGFLLDERVITSEHIKSVKTSPDHPKQVRQLLADLKSNEKVQLLEYHWQLLPVEIIKLTIVTDRNNKEFSYEGS